MKSNKPDPAPHKSKLCHSDMITCSIIIYPDDAAQLSNEQIRRKMKYATSSRDGKVKIWNAHTMQHEMTITVTKEETGKKDPSKKVWVTCITYMTLSKRLVAASANRMISFYDLNSTNYSTPVSRIEGLVGIPLCMEYNRWPKNNDSKLETLLVGDDLGICNKYDFTHADWHICQYKIGCSDPNMCHAMAIEDEFKDKINKEFEEKEKVKEEKKSLKAKIAWYQMKGKSVPPELQKQYDDAKEKLYAKKKVIEFSKHQTGVKNLPKLIHKGWITKIKFYPDLNYIISSSLDGFIHIHDIEALQYKENKTFNLH